MNVLIVEDEKLAADKLEKYLHRYDPQIRVVGRTDSVQATVQWLRQHMEEADLLFLDIELSDGQSFEVFKQVTVDKPVIFITAYNQYAIEAFKVNSIDYLLKPLNFGDLSQSLEKLKSLARHLPKAETALTLDSLSEVISKLQKNYKQRFMVKSGERIRSFSTSQIDLFFAEGRTAYLVTSEGYKYVIDYKLEELEELLDPQHFFRVNRSFILNIQAIRDVLMYSNSRLKIALHLDFAKEIIVSREKVPVFKDWFNGVETL
jgi:two-component system, LytTR family, response regulator